MSLDQHSFPKLLCGRPSLSNFILLSFPFPCAFCSLTHIIKLHPFTPRTNNFVLHALIELLDHPGDVQIQATFAIAKLVGNDQELQIIACESYDVIKKLAGLLDKSSVVTSPGYGAAGGGGINGIASLSRLGGVKESRAGGAVDEGLIRLREVSQLVA